MTGRAFALNGAVTLDSNASTAVASGSGGAGGQQCKDFTTGGGSIAGPSGGKATFGFEVGCKCGQQKGDRDKNQDSTLGGEVV